MEPADETLHLPPFPPLLWEEFFWAGEDTFPAWAGFGADGAADGRAHVHVSAADDEWGPPAPAQAAAYAHLVAHQEAVREAVLAAVAAVYPAWQRAYGYTGDEARRLMPDLDGPDGLRALTRLGTVNVLTAARDGVAYVGLGFGCTWDGEHGLGAMTHAGRVVEVGGADTAILDWIAERDAEGRP